MAACAPELASAVSAKAWAMWGRVLDVPGSIDVVSHRSPAKRNLLCAPPNKEGEHKEDQPYCLSILRWEEPQNGWGIGNFRIDSPKPLGVGT